MNFTKQDKTDAPQKCGALFKGERMKSRRVRRVFLRLDERWITIGPKSASGKKHGVHVLVDDDGVIAKGPSGFVGLNVSDLGKLKEARKAAKKEASESALGGLTANSTKEDWTKWLKEAPVGTSVTKYLDNYKGKITEYRKNKNGRWREVSGYKGAPEFLKADDLVETIKGGGNVSIKNAAGEKWNVCEEKTEKQKARGYDVKDAYEKAGIKIDPKVLEAAKDKIPKYIEFDEPELREYMQYVWAGYNLPISILERTKVWKNLENRMLQAIADYGHTAKKTNRKELRKSIKDKFYANGAWSGKKKDENGKEYDVYDGEVKKGRRAVIVIGYPAAGKSSSIVNKVSQNEGAYVLDSDIIKEMIPEFQKTHGAAVSGVNKEANLIRSEVIEEFMKGGSREGDNIVIPIIGDQVGSVENYIKRLSPAGYDIEIQYKRAPIRQSANRMVSRAIETGRIIPLDVLDVHSDPESVFRHYSRETNSKGLPYVRTEAK